MVDIPNLRHLRAFIYIAESGSISKASELVFLSQPALTQAIAKLENAVKATLFERRSDGMHLTSLGMIFNKRVSRAINILDDELTKILNIKTGSSKKSKPSNYINTVTITQLRALLAVAENKSYSAAGRSIGVSQSSLYRASKELEASLDVVLFEKTSLGISISKVGLGLLKATKLAFKEIQQGLEEISSEQLAGAGRIVIGSMPLARTCLLPETINDFSYINDDFNIKVVEGDYSDLLYHLRNGEIDVLIGALRFPPPAVDIRQETLFDSSNNIIARTDHPLTKVDDLTMDILAEQSWVVPGEHTPARRMFNEFFSDTESYPQKLIETSSQILVREILLGSNKLAILSKHQVQRELNEGKFTILDFPSFSHSRPIGLTFRQNWHATELQKSFISLLRDKGLALSVLS